jgi:NADPH:quinone reductase-like Zn-dependent oxidoreductase
MPPESHLEIRSHISANGVFKLWLDDVPTAAPGPDEVLVRLEAAPINPSDQSLLLGSVDLATLRSTGSPERPVVEGIVPAERLAAISSRLDRALPVGNEGAGTVVAAGAQAIALIGRTVAIRATTGTYAQYQTVKASDCLILPDGMTAREGAAAFINPLTALGMVETMRREGHSALVHTAAASNLGQMLNRLCLADKVPLVNIVRSAEQVALLRTQGAIHVLDSSLPDFEATLSATLDETGATLAFDAIGGGTMASTILTAMERVQTAKLAHYSRYGAPVHKQVYIYGVLDPAPRRLDGQFGMAWGVGGWLMTWFYDKIGPTDAARLRKRAADELGSTFASHFTREISLTDALSPDAIRAFSRRATGEKYLMVFPETAR